MVVDVDFSSVKLWLKLSIVLMVSEAYECLLVRLMEAEETNPDRKALA